jgi:uncharacterized membrane protein YidH (DUF202 family)
MKTHQVAAIVIGVIILVVSFLPVIFLYNTYDISMLGYYPAVHIFVYPTVGVVVAGLIVFLSFFKGRDKE